MRCTAARVSIQLHYLTRSGPLRYVTLPWPNHIIVYDKSSSAVEDVRNSCFGSLPGIAWQACRLPPVQPYQTSTLLWPRLSSPSALVCMHFSGIACNAWGVCVRFCV